MIPHILTIAGSDSGGGAGIQADLKTFSALGAYGATVITALTAQNTQGVQAVHLAPAAFVTAQLDAVFTDIRIDAVKTGMLGDVDIVHAVAAALRRYRPAFIVVDPVMLSTSGHALLAPEAVAALRTQLLPLAGLFTPNLAEAALLLGEAPAQDEAAMVRQGQALRALGADAVLMKGGHLPPAEGDIDAMNAVSPDWLITAQGATRVSAARVDTPHTHGTGCTLSAAIAALRPQRAALPMAVSDAKAWLTQALEHAHRLDVGQPGAGHGPLHHFHQWW